MTAFFLTSRIVAPQIYIVGVRRIEMFPSVIDHLKIREAGSPKMDKQRTLKIKKHGGNRQHFPRHRAHRYSLKSITKYFYFYY
jgi:hypothetical protein